MAQYGSMAVIIKAFILILLLSFIMSCSRLEIEPDSHFDMPYSHTDFPCVAPMVVILLSDGSTMGWDCLPDSVKDGELRMDWKRYPESQRQGKLVLFAVYLSGPYQGRAYRPRKDDLGKHIVRDGKKVYLHIRLNE